MRVILTQKIVDVSYLLRFYDVIRQGAAVSRSTRYLLAGVTYSEAGVYECTADNGVGNPATRRIYVNVLCQ